MNWKSAGARAMRVASLGHAIGHLDGLELHLKEAPKNQDERRHRRDNEHLDAAAGVDGIEAFFRQCVANGATILKPLTPTAWG